MDVLLVNLTEEAYGDIGEVQIAPGKLCLVSTIPHRLVASDYRAQIVQSRGAIADIQAAKIGLTSIIRESQQIAVKGLVKPR
ncbi:hypothetical protein D9M71_669840 [compost metagenome]